MIEPVTIERRGSIAIVTLNTPAKRNALTPDLCRALIAALGSLQEELEIRALVLHGGRHFCSGGDLTGLDDPALVMRREMLNGHRIIRALIGERLPVVAAVEGNAYGAGFSIAMACDFVVADENSTFCAAFGKVGLTPDYGLLWSLPARVGMGLAREIVLFCEPIKGVQAKEWRIADRLAEKDRVLDAATAMAERLAALPPGTVTTTKAVLARQPLNLDTMLAWEADTQSLLARSADFAEGVRAFQERRPPRFKGVGRQ